MVAETICCSSQRDIKSTNFYVPAYQGTVVSKVPKVSSLKQHLSVTLWVWAHNLRVHTKRIYSVRPRTAACCPRPFAMVEIKSLKLFNWRWWWFQIRINSCDCLKRIYNRNLQFCIRVVFSSLSLFGIWHSVDKRLCFVAVLEDPFPESIFSPVFSPLLDLLSSPSTFEIKILHLWRKYGWEVWAQVWEPGPGES